MKALWLLVFGCAGLLLTGCGGSTTRTIAVTVPTPPVPTTTSHAATAATSSAVDKAAPSPHGPPDFILNESAQSGDKLKLEGRFGPLLPAGESDVDQNVLAGCSGVDGRELITRLDLTATIESGLSAHVTLANLAPSAVTPHVDFVIDNAEGSTCSSGDANSEEAAEEAANPNLGTLQPHEPHHFTMWVVLTDAITPNDPHPSTVTLAHGQWLSTFWEQGSTTRRLAYLAPMRQLAGVSSLVLPKPGSTRRRTSPWSAVRHKSSIPVTRRMNCCVGNRGESHEAKTGDSCQ